MGYKCVNCKSIKKEGAKVFFIPSIESEYLMPTCSEACAREYIENDIKTLERKIEALKNVKIEEDIWD